MTGTARRLTLGTRRSPLALAQSGQVARALEALHPGLTVELVPIETQGDRTPGDLAAFGGKGLFTEELERGLLDGEIDLAVHSLKDLPVRLPEGLVVAAYPERADPRDVLVSEVAGGIDSLPKGSVVLTGSLRRKAQVLLPAPGQGILALEVKAEGPADILCLALDHAPSRRAAEAERRVVAAFGGDCTLPLAAYAEEVEGEGLRLRALLASPDGGTVARGEGVGATPEEAAERCVAAMREAGAEGLLATLRRA
jgi:hydroxymethylbilane synthase